jgi:heat shock protein HtpX
MLNANGMKTALLLGALAGLLIVIGGMIGGSQGMLFAFIISVIMNLGAWWFSDTLALTMSRARPVTEQQAPELYQMTAVLARNANMPMPRLYVIDSPMANAFATGRSPEKGAVAVTTGIMRLLNRDELAGVIAHELSHIRHRDTLISSIAATIASAITMLANMARWSLMFGGTGSRRDGSASAGSALGALLMAFLAPIAALIIQMAISRSREYLADAYAARILGNPAPLASALEKLELSAARTPVQVNPATSHMYIVNPLRGGLAGLFSTHPPTGERIARLMAMRPEDLS